MSRVELHGLVRGLRQWLQVQAVQGGAVGLRPAPAAERAEVEAKLKERARQRVQRQLDAIQQPGRDRRRAPEPAQGKAGQGRAPKPASPSPKGSNKAGRQGARAGQGSASRLPTSTTPSTQSGAPGRPSTQSGASGRPSPARAALQGAGAGAAEELAEDVAQKLAAPRTTDDNMPALWKSQKHKQLLAKVNKPGKQSAGAGEARGASDTQGAPAVQGVGAAQEQAKGAPAEASAKARAAQDGASAASRGSAAIEEEFMSQQKDAGDSEMSPERKLEWLRGYLGDCQRCGLSEGRCNIVFGDGAPQARLVFVGEAPGYYEDQRGIPFVGKAGALLDKMIEAMGFSREDVYITNVLKCRPPNNRDPLPDEVGACSPFLAKQLEVLQPEVIVTLGRFASNTLLEENQTMGRLRGQWHEWNGVPLMATYHPAYLLRNPEDKRKTWDDLQKVMARLHGDEP